MRHRVAGRKLGRTTEHRVAMLRNLSTSLFANERIRTTLAKAKELRPFAEKLVTLSKKETLHARRLVARHIHDRAVVTKLFDTLSARYAARPGGYTRIVKLGPRRGDNAEMAIIELVDAERIGAETVDSDEAAAPKKKAAKRSAKKKAAAKPDTAEPEGATPKATKKTAKKKTTKKTAKKSTAKKSAAKDS